MDVVTKVLESKEIKKFYHVILIAGAVFVIVKGLDAYYNFRMSVYSTRIDKLDIELKNLDIISKKKELNII